MAFCYFSTMVRFKWFSLADCLCYNLVLLRLFCLGRLLSSVVFLVKYGQDFLCLFSLIFWVGFPLI